MSDLKFHIGYDSITKEHPIEWSHYLILRRLGESWECHLDFNVKNGRPCLHFRFRGITLRVKDKLYLGNISSTIELTVSEKPHQFNDKFKEVDFILLEDDLNLLKNHLTSISKLHIRHHNGDTPFEAYIYTIYSRSYKRDINDVLARRKDEEECNFSHYFEQYLQALREARFRYELFNDIENNSSEPRVSDKDSIAQRTKADECYVYLMHDKRNGYHKIGISKEPKYREKTLQSEQPAIEMVCNKKYPSRKIAETIEYALHRAYAEQRVRGEWFDLSPLDIQMLKETLS